MTRYLRMGLRALTALCVLLAAGYALAFRALPRPATAGEPASAGAARVAGAVQLPPNAWSVFAPAEAAGAARGNLATIYRLAGTYFLDGVRRAVLDHLEKKEQFFVSEGDRVDQGEVVRIDREYVVLRTPSGLEELWKSFSTEERGGGEGATDAAGRDLQWDERVLETSAFGKRIAENRWILSRDALLGYHEAMLDNPERLAALFLSMKPDYQDNDIAGYRVDLEGEQEFFSAIGLGEGDVVREVNSMRMTSQKRAEYFIREFAQGRLSAVVLDIERNGDPQKLIYYIR